MASAPSRTVVQMAFCRCAFLIRNAQTASPIDTASANERTAASAMTVIICEFPLRLGDFLGEARQLLAIEHLRVDETGNDFGYRAFTEPVSDSLHSASGSAATSLGALIDERAPLDGMGEVPLLFETPQHRADRRLLQRPTQLAANFVGGSRAQSPHVQQHFALQVPEIRQIVVRHKATPCNVTDGSTWPRPKARTAGDHLRLRPIMMTALVAALGLLPAAEV